MFTDVVVAQPPLPLRNGCFFVKINRTEEKKEAIGKRINRKRRERFAEFGFLAFDFAQSRNEISERELRTARFRIRRRAVSHRHIRGRGGDDGFSKLACQRHKNLGRRALADGDDNYDYRLGLFSENG